MEEEDVSGSVPQSWAKFSKNNVEESQGGFLYLFENYGLGLLCGEYNLDKIISL